MPATMRIPESKRIVHVADSRGLRVVERWHAPQERVPWHVNDRPALTCVLHGGFQESLRTGSLDCGARTVLFKPPGERHSNQAGDDGAHCVAVELPQSSQAFLPAVQRVASARTDALVSLLVAELADQDPHSALAIEGLVLEIVAAIGRTPRDRKGSRPDWLDGTLEDLRSRFREPFSVRNVAANAGVTPAHLTRVLVRYEGRTPSAYVRRLRVEWVKVQLLRTDSSLAALAAAAGFADQSHLTRAFLQYEGTTPGRFRRQVTAAPLR